MKTILLLLLIPAIASSQVQNLYFVDKYSKPVFAEKDYQPGQHAFYIYRNCVYSFIIKNLAEITAHVHDIRNDSIYYTHFSAYSDFVYRDTHALHPSQISRISALGDRNLSLLRGLSVRNKNYVFVNSDAAKTFPRQIDSAFSADSSYSSIGEWIPFLTERGIDRTYKLHSKTVHKKIDPPAYTPKFYPKITRNWAWFSPSNATTVNGLNVGALTMNAHNDTLHINGVNLNADVLSAVACMYASVYVIAYIPHKLFGKDTVKLNINDTIYRERTEVIIKGVSISGGGLMFPADISGVSINGGVCAGAEVKGLVISGLFTVAYDFRGVVVAGLFNTAEKGRGVQISVVNKCKQFKGIQIGLWNINNKRKLPLINWSF